MELSVTHPRRFEIRGKLFQIASTAPLTDEKAAKAAMLFYQSRKFKKSDQGKLFLVPVGPELADML